MLDLLKELDEGLFLLLNGLGSPFLDRIMFWLSDKYIWIPLYAFLLFHLYRQMGWRFYQSVLAIVLLIILTDQFTSSLMKPFFQRFRPCNDPSLQDWVFTLDHCGGKYGFASSHAANTFGLAAFFYFREHSRLAIFLLIWASIVSYSRIYLGVHYPGDILVGALIGISLAWFIQRILQRLITAD